MKPLRRLGFALWLALALVVGQQAALLHDLGHASERLAQQDSKPAPAKCDTHFTCAQLAGGVAPTVCTVPPVACGVPVFSFIERVAFTATPLGYRAQAPPVLL